MNSRYLIFLFLFFLSSCEYQFPKEKDVIILTDSTFEKAINTYQYLMVFFYAPWCIRCNKFHPEYDEAASILKNENLYLAKVDATTEKKLEKKFKLTGFPVLKLFIKGKPIEYNGERNHEDLVKWIRKKTTGSAIEELFNEEDIDIFKQSDDVVMIYFGKDENDIKECIKIARKDDNIPFGIIKDENLIKKYANNDRKIILYKNFDEKSRELNIIKEKEIQDFINKYSTPKLMRNITEKINYKLKVVITDIRDVIGAKNAELMNIKENELPTLRIADSSGEYLKKYKMEGELNEDNIIQFVNDWEHKKLKPYIKSAKIPEENNEDVFVLVGKTFEKEVINNDKDVIVLFYSSLCYHLRNQCKELLKKYSEVAKRLKRLNPKLVLAKIDFGENEVESIQMSDFPKIKIFPGNKKDKEPIDYEGDNSIDDIIKFIKKNSWNHIFLDENEEL